MFFISKLKFILGMAGMLGIGGNGKTKPDSVCTGGGLISADVAPCPTPTWPSVGEFIAADEELVGLLLGTGVIGGGIRASTCRISAGGYRGIRQGIMWGGSRAKVVNSWGKFAANSSRGRLSLACEGCKGIPGRGKRREQ